MDKMVAFYCATYRRPHLLEQAIACFLAQDFDGPKMLAIINDEPEQTLVFDHPEIHIVNMDVRLPLVDKLNYAIDGCVMADVLFHMDDDDLFSPDRVAVSLSGMRGGVFKTDEFILDTDPACLVRGRNLGNYAFTPEVAYRYGKPYMAWRRHPYADINLMTKLDVYMREYGFKCKRPEAPFFLYRKNHGWTNYSARGSRFHYEISEVDIPFERGRIELEPKLDFDFNTLAIEDEPKKINEVDSTYSDVDLTMFYNGMEV